VGGGNFLVHAGDLICRRLKAEQGDIFGRCLFGVDRDAEAVDEARKAIARHGTLDASAKRRLSRRLVVGDSLADPFPIATRKPFDVILCNPPYVGFKTWSRDAALRRRLKAQYACFDWHADLFYFFIERGLQLLAPGGRMGMITSRYFLRSSSAAKLRGIALPHMADFTDLKDSDTFPDLGIHCAISIYEKAAVRRRPAASARERDVPCFDVPTVPLGEVAEVRAGLQSGRDSIFVKAITKEKGRFVGQAANGERIEVERELIHRFIKNRDIEPYRVMPSRWCLFVDDRLSPGELRRQYPGAYRLLRSYRDVLLARRSSFKKVTARNWTEWMHWSDAHFAPRRIVCPYRARTNRFAFAPRGALGSIDVGFIVPHGISPPALLALLNSRLLQEVYHSYAKELAPGVYDYYPNHLSQLPVPLVDSATPRADRRRQIETLRAALDRGKGRAWLRKRRPSDVLLEVLAVLAREMSRNPREGIRALIDRVVDALYGV